LRRLIVARFARPVNHFSTRIALGKEVHLNAEETVTVFLHYFFIKSAEGGLKMDGYSYLTFDQRREIEALYGEGIRTVDIAAKIGRSVAAIYEELKRGYTGELDENKRPVYSADLAQMTAQENIRRRGNRRATADGR
jgi:hypothetical protein